MHSIIIRRTAQIVLLAGLLALLAHQPAASDSNLWSASVAIYSGSGWLVETVDSQDDVGRHASLALDLVLGQLRARGG